MADDARRPILNPVLTLLDDPTPRRATGGGKSKKDIKIERLDSQRSVLSKKFHSMASSAHVQPNFNRNVVIYADMFDDSFAASYAPKDIFSVNRGAFLTIPYKGGYLLQAQMDKLVDLANAIENASTASEMVDISRVRDVRFFDRSDVLGYRNIDKLWSDALEAENGRSFIVWLMRFKTHDAIESVIKKFESLRNESVVFSPVQLSEIARSRSIQRLEYNLPIGDFEYLLTEATNGDRISLALLEYLLNYKSRSAMIVPTKEKLNELLISGSVFRIDPSVPISVSVTKSSVSKLELLPSDIEKYPSVGLVDGGLVPNIYDRAVKWEDTTKLVPDQFAAKDHGTQ